MSNFGSSHLSKIASGKCLADGESVEALNRRTAYFGKLLSRSRKSYMLARGKIRI